MDSNTGQFVQYGCGLTAPESWRNFDVSPTLRLQRLPVVGGLFRRTVRPVFPRNIEYGNIVRGLPIPPESCAAIYCSHVLEHLSLEDFRRAIRNTYRCLRPGGVFRLVVPDLEYCAHEYLHSDAPDASIHFMTETRLGREVRPRSLTGFLRAWLGNAAHLWMWDEKSLTVELEQAGFRDIRRAAFNDSTDPRFRDVETLSRWENCLGMEGRRQANG